MAGNRVNLTFNMSDGEERSASFVLPEAEQKLQSDIYDRTKGVGAIPGSFGYGSDLVGIDTVYFNNKAEFLTWVHNTPSGRYLVSQRYGSEPVINSDVTFSGILEVIPTTSVGDEQYLPNVEKDIIFYGANLGDIWYTRFTTLPNRLEAWRCLDKTEDIINLQNSLNSKASLYSPSFSGTPTTPTPSDDAVGLEIANAAFVRKLISALVDSSPEALDTLNELAAALGDDPNFSTTMLNALAQKQPLHEILTSLSGLASAANKLPYFSGKNVMSMTNLSDVGRVIIGQPSKAEVLSYLGMDVQSTIYDRTDGVVARPGAFGYGAFYPVAKRFDDTDGPTEFLMWVMQTPPGRYLVKQVESSGTTKIINGVNFVGMVEIEQPYLEADAGSTASFNKLVHFYGVDGDMYHNRFIANPSNPQMSGWFTLKNQINFLRSTTGNSWGSPGVGGLMLGVYLGESDSDSSRKLIRGKTVPGSRLGCVSLSGKVSTSGGYQSSPTLITHGEQVQAGTFMALSGSPSDTSSSDAGYIGLFMRIA